MIYRLKSLDGDELEFLSRFTRESNKIEGITRAPTYVEIGAHRTFFGSTANISDLNEFVRKVQPDAFLRNISGVNVRVGSHVPPPGGPNIETRLKHTLLAARVGADPHRVHTAYETLHPFTDGNGRSGRALWMWMMLRRSDAKMARELGFLHTFYYQTLERCDDRVKQRSTREPLKN